MKSKKGFVLKVGNLRHLICQFNEYQDFIFENFDGSVTFFDLDFIQRNLCCDRDLI